MRFNFKNRFDNLPQGSVVDKLLFVLYRRICRRLKRKQMLDINGMWYPKHQPSLVEKQTKPSVREQDLICITGFGYSGSGAVLDILSEFENVTLVHGVDKDSGRKLNNTIDSEFDLLRHAGGVFDLEEALG